MQPLKKRLRSSENPRSSSPNDSTGSNETGYTSSSPPQFPEKSSNEGDQTVFSDEDHGHQDSGEEEFSDTSDEFSEEDDGNDEEYVPEEPDIKEEPLDFWGYEQANEQEAQPGPAEPEGEEEETELDDGERGKLIRQRLKEIRMQHQKAQEERKTDEPADTEDLNYYLKQLREHKMEEERSKKRRLDSSDEEEYFEKIEKRRVPGEGRKKKEAKPKKMRATKNMLPEYEENEVIDLTRLDMDFCNPAVKNEAEEQEVQVKQELPGPRDRVTGQETLLHSKQVTEVNLERILNSTGAKRVRWGALDDIVLGFYAEAKVGSLKRKEDVRSLAETRITFVLTFKLKYDVRKRRSMIFRLGWCYDESGNVFRCNHFLQRFNSWLADQSDKGARAWLTADSTASKKEAVTCPYVLEAGKETHAFLNKVLISNDEGDFKTGLVLASRLVLRITDLEKHSVVQSMDKLQQHISTRFNFAINADDDLRKAFVRDKKVLAYLLLRCKGHSMHCRTDCGIRPELLEFDDQQKIIKEDRQCPNCQSCLITNPSHIKCKFHLKLEMTADELNTWKVIYPVRNTLYHGEQCPANDYFKKLLEPLLRKKPKFPKNPIDALNNET
ncbi:Oidioi.mRNA.OKI2018_I69.chr1.g2274.t1.cds [Oikopleura dioica]|uniref:Oidioi.mRNA.OKI2018_I69.chr1.g2274.t1.cds n=1 Tax=Oikopleura dioica TaxID=34765 RepID=A0ABN7SQM0_OIKDI|nr:Oidioi.mRNA.OKI2018_I69.chr1.g2274.t1.cds [Oikopleura dioica]